MIASRQPETQVEFKQWEQGLLSENIANQVRLIYEASFPASEREPFPQVLQRLVPGQVRLYLALASECVLGFALTQAFPEGNIHFLEYFAVDPAARSRGTGGGLLRCIVKALAASGGSGLLFEVEDPEAAVDVSDANFRSRRIEFYRRNGAYRIEDGQAYRMPDQTGPGSLPMRLMWLPCDPSSHFPPLPDLPSLFALIYLRIYGRREDDPLLQSLLNALPPS